MTTTTGPRNPEKLPHSFMRDLSVTLTEDELKVRAQDLATAIDERIDVEREKKEANDAWNRQVKDSQSITGTGMMYQTISRV